MGQHPPSVIAIRTTAHAMPATGIEYNLDREEVQNHSQLISLPQPISAVYISQPTTSQVVLTALRG